MLLRGFCWDEIITFVKHCPNIPWRHSEEVKGAMLRAYIGSLRFANGEGNRWINHSRQQRKSVNFKCLIIRHRNAGDQMSLGRNVQYVSSWDACTSVDYFEEQGWRNKHAHVEEVLAAIQAQASRHWACPRIQWYYTLLAYRRTKIILYSYRYSHCEQVSVNFGVVQIFDTKNEIYIVLYCFNQKFCHMSQPPKMNSSLVVVTGHFKLWTVWQLKQKRNLHKGPKNQQQTY